MEDLEIMDLLMVGLFFIIIIVIILYNICVKIFFFKSKDGF